MLEHGAVVGSMQPAPRNYFDFCFETAALTHQDDTYQKQNTASNTPPPFRTQHFPNKQTKLVREIWTGWEADSTVQSVYSHM